MDVADGGATENGDALKPAPFSAVPGRRHNRGWKVETDPRLTRKQDNGSTFGFWGSARVWEAFFCPLNPRKDD